MRILLLGLALLNLWLCAAKAATLNSDGTVTDTQNEIDAAVSGDTVLFPAAGSFTWAGGVTVPSTKGITLDFNGSTITRGAFSGKLVNIDNNATTSTKMIGAKFVQTDNAMADLRILDIDGSFSNAKFIITNCWFTTTPAHSTIMVDIGEAWGVFSNCKFTAPDNSEMIHNLAYGPGDATGWTEDVTPGSLDAVYIETCAFTNNGGGLAFLGNAPVQNYYGSRIVFRYNQVMMGHVDVHGTGGNIGGRWWEIYSNNFYTVFGGDVSDIMSLRAGSGFVFQNTATHGGGGGRIGGIELEEEDSGPYPQLYQVGRGKNQALYPAYFWNNNVSVFVTGTSLILANRDYYLQQANYTTAPYPHPLLAGVAGTPAIQSATVAANGTNWTLVFTMAITPGGGGNGGFAGSMSGGSVSFGYVSGAGTTTIVLVSTRSVQSFEFGTLAYTQPGDGWETSDGIDLPSFSGFPVVNNAAATNTSPRRLRIRSN